MVRVDAVERLVEVLGQAGGAGYCCSFADCARAGPDRRRAAGRDLQRHAWRWADADRAADGSLPSAKAIAAKYGRHQWWVRLVSRLGTAGERTGAPQ